METIPEDLPEVDDQEMQTPSTSAGPSGRPTGPGLGKAGAKRPPGDPVTEARAAKFPSLREQFTQAYEAKVAHTKLTRDPRLRKGTPHTLHTNLYLPYPLPTLLLQT